MTENIIIIVILVAIVAAIVTYIYSEKKKGATCIGCPYSKKCQGRCNGSCNHEKTNKSN